MIDRNLRMAIKKIPAIGSVASAGARATKYLRGKLSDQQAIRALAQHGHPLAPTFADAISQAQTGLEGEDCTRVAAVEGERRRLHESSRPLIDDDGEGAVDYDAGLTVGDAVQASVSSRQALIVYLLTRHLKPRNVLELGTNVGISSAFIASALKAGGNAGRLTTFEGSRHRLAVAREVHDNLALDNVAYVQGMFEDTLAGALDDMEPVDLAFIDGHHQYEPTLRYFELIWRNSTPDAVFIFDDIRWSDGMKKVWSEIVDDQRFELLVDLNRMGVCVRRAARGTARFVSPAIYDAL